MTSTSTGTYSTSSVNGSLFVAFLGSVPSGSYSLAAAGHILTGGSTPTMGTCGTSPSVVGNDTAGVITVGSGVVTSCTLNFAKAWANPPVVIVSTNSTAVTGDISSVSTSSVVFGFSATLGGGIIYYHSLGY